MLTEERWKIKKCTLGYCEEGVTCLPEGRRIQGWYMERKAFGKSTKKIEPPVPWELTSYFSAESDLISMVTFCNMSITWTC